MLTTNVHWHDLLPSIFSDHRFRQTGRGRFYGSVDGARAGVVVAWRGAEYDNHAINRDDLTRLLDLKRNGTFEAAFVVAARRSRNSAHVYVGARDADEVQQALETVPLRAGPFGDYWLLREDLKPVAALVAADDDVPF
jgi:hypothetical protein